MCSKSTCEYPQIHCWWDLTAPEKRGEQIVRLTENWLEEGRIRGEKKKKESAEYVNMEWLRGRGRRSVVMILIKRLRCGRRWVTREFCLCSRSVCTSGTNICDEEEVEAARSYSQYLPLATNIDPGEMREETWVRWVYCHNTHIYLYYNRFIDRYTCIHI